MEFRKVNANIARDVLDTYMKLTQVFGFCMKHTLQKYGLYEGQPAILFMLKELERPTQIELADALGISKASVGVSLRRMEKAGFVRRRQDKGDSRCNRISLTEKGEEFVRWCEMDMDMIANNMLEDFEGDEREAALQTLQRLYKGLDFMRMRIKL